MSFTEAVIDRTKHIESLLAELGGTGKGLHERASSIESLLNYQLLRRLRFIASVRNKLLHEHNYNYDGDQQRFLSTCDATIFQLSSLISARQPPPTTEPNSPDPSSPSVPVEVVVIPPHTYTPRSESPTAIQPEPVPTDPPAKPTASNGCLPAIVCAVISCVILPFSCTRTVTHWFSPDEQITEWDQVIFWTFIWATVTFFIARSATKQ